MSKQPVKENWNSFLSQKTNSHKAATSYESVQSKYFGEPIKS